MNILKKSQQRGLSLISLLVGLLISMLCILAGLTLYRSTLQMSTTAKLDAQVDGQVTSALLTLSRELQNAGFQATETSVDHIVRFNHGSGSSSTAVLAWRYRDGADFVCRGVKEFARTANQISYRNLALVNADGCDGDVDLTTLEWAPTDESKTIILGRWPVVPEVQKYLDDNINLFTLGVPQLAQCSPYGASQAKDHLQVTISAPSSAVLNEAVGALDHSTTICLLNTAGS